MTPIFEQQPKPLPLLSFNELTKSTTDSSNDEEEVFADAREKGPSPTSPASPVPTTRVEKIDDSPSHGEVPGTMAYDVRANDAVPDEITVVPERGRSSSRPDSAEGSSTPRGTPIPRTRVEKVDPASPSHGEVPGTAAHDMRKADAVPDFIVKASPPGSPSKATYEPSSSGSSGPVPRTVITRADSLSQPKQEGVPGTDAYDSSNAYPDVEKKGELPSKHISYLKR